MVSNRSNGINRSVIVALAGLVLIAAGEPPKKTGYSDQTDATKPEQHSAPMVLLDAPQTIPKVNAEEQKNPCGNGRYNSNDELCAQWKAADAASDAAKWARLQLWLSGLGVVGLIISLVFTRRALIAADNTNKAFIRAEAGMLVPGIELFGVGLWAESFKISLHNVGRTPVTIIHYQFHCVEDISAKEIKVPIDADANQYGIMIDAGKPFVLPYNDISNQPDLVRMIGGAIYTDMFGRASSCQIGYLVNRRTRSFDYDFGANFADWDKLIKKQNAKKK